MKGRRPTMDYKSIGKRIREERTGAGLTQLLLSEKIGISDTYLGAVERGEKIPSIETLFKIANALNITIDYLLCDPLDAKDQIVMDQIRSILDGQSMERKKMAVDVLSAIFKHMGKKEKKSQR